MRLLRLTALAATTAAAAVAITAAAPAAFAYPPGGSVSTAQISSTSLTAGGSVTVTVQATTPGTLTMQILSAPVTIGAGTVSSTTFSGSVTGTVPLGYSGAHTIEVRGAGGEVFDFAVVVTDPTDDGSGGSDGGSGGGLASTGEPVLLTAGIGLVVLLVGGAVTLTARSRRSRTTG